MATRRASHAGSWYCDSAKELDDQLENWMNAAELSHGPARAIIAPHAAYQYCGACAAFAYRQVSPAVVKHVFILGPSHHVRLSGCALTNATKYETPFYDLTIDQQVYNKLKATGEFDTMTLSVDEAEHSIEMHLPYIAKVMADFKDTFTIVPILVGSLTSDEEAIYGSILAPFLADPQNLFVISSDFCHWGQRFRYTFYDKNWGEIHQSIQTLDKTGMDIIERLDPPGFSDYLKKYGNTICGRHPIGVLLQAKSPDPGPLMQGHKQLGPATLRRFIHFGPITLQLLGGVITISNLRNTSTNGQRVSLKFLKYAQSNQCYTMSDSSVSYASAALVFE